MSKQLGLFERVLIIGYGFAGLRFERVLNHIALEDPSFIAKIGICDISESKLAQSSNPLQFTDLSLALLEIKPTVIVVAVNEEDHFEVLLELQSYIPRLLLIEKPLTATLEQALEIQPLFGKTKMSLNMVERYSPIVHEYRNWKHAHLDMKVTRVEFFWGKQKFGDPRPSIGVLSEIAHPLDLIGLICDVEKLSVSHAIGSASDFLPNNDRLLDNIDVILQTPYFPIIGHSSFLWSERKRHINIYLSDGKQVYSVEMKFDNPYWDADQLVIKKLNWGYQSNASTVHSFQVKNTDFQSELNQVYKVYRYVKTSILCDRLGIDCNYQVDYKQALKIQRVLHSIADKLMDDNLLHHSIFDTSLVTE